VARVGGEQLPAGVVEPDLAQVAARGGVEVAAECQLHGANGDAGRRGDVGDGDVLVSVLVNEDDSPVQRGRGTVVPARDGRVGDRAGRARAGRLGWRGTAGKGQGQGVAPFPLDGVLYPPWHQ
jgi:hypothetical protein